MAINAFRPLPVVLVVTIAAMAVAGCDSGDSGADVANAAPLVEAVPADEGALPQEERVSGIVKAENQVAIRPELSGPIVEVLVRNGDAVNRGQPLVRQDPSLFATQLRESEASARLAKAAAEEERARVREIEARVSRFRSLSDERLVSEQDLETLEAQLAAARASADQADARVDQADANLEEARRDLERTTIRAPIAGKVGRRDAEVGMMAGPGDVLFVIGNLDDLIIEIPLTEQMLRSVKEGQPVRIHSALIDGGSVQGELTRISPFLESSSMSTVGEIEIRNPGGKLQPGMFVEVDLLYGESEQATLVPTSALWEDPKTRVMTVWVAGEPEPDVPDALVPIARREVEVIGEGQVSAAVTGVRPGEWAVVVGQHLLESDGARARVRATTWERAEALQRLQREDLLADYLARQQELAKTLGARPMTNEEFLGANGRVDVLESGRASQGGS
jgi:RND family efflux transporter MFP subunit